MNHYRIKFWLYRHDQGIISFLILCLLVVIAFSIVDVITDGGIIGAVPDDQIEFRTWLGMILGILTLLFAFMRQKHNDMSIFFQLFEKYNQRYDELNGIMNIINSKTKNLVSGEGAEPFDGLDNKQYGSLRKHLTDSDTVENVLDDYLNLCAEEYMAYCNGYIPPQIMEYWYKGMEVFFKNPHMRKYFKHELGNDSYYEFKSFAEKQFEKIEADEA
ncbi:MAG: hypothetical protein CL666_10510 [Balneola sp.]|nr:hypothetical protein [Balneola sp.]|tara:strand:- start:37139 stop:37786 length:648 start_codon:yes stop_codon:yes gene_type:complete